MNLTTELVLTSPAGFAITTASPLQRAICRIIDGLPLAELATHPDVLAAIGCDPSLLPLERPAEVDILAGIRTAKSIIDVAAAIVATQTCDVSGLGREIARVAIVSCVSLDLAHVEFEHVCGVLTGGLSSLLVATPNADSVLVRHPSGKTIEIKVSAGAAAGGSVAGRWLAGLIISEHGRGVGSADGKVVNYDDLRGVALGRMLPGAQILSNGSPRGPYGPAYERAQKHWGKPSKNVVVIRAAAAAMNPGYWTPARCARLEEQDKNAHRMDCLALFGSGETTAFESDHVDASMMSQLPAGRLARALFIDPTSGGSDRYAWMIGGMMKPTAERRPRFLDMYSPSGELLAAGMIVDQDENGNVIYEEDRWAKLHKEGVFVVEACGQFAANFYREGVRGDDVLDQIAKIARAAGVRDVHSDQRERLLMRDGIEKRGFHFFEHVWSQSSKHEAVELLRAMFRDRRIIIMAGSESARLRQQLVTYRKRIDKRTGEPKYDGPTDDLASTLITAAHAMAAHELRDAPAYRGSGVRTSGPGWGV